MDKLIGKQSPWGIVEGSHTIAVGIENVWTSSHGGIKLSAMRQSLMPKDIRHELKSYGDPGNGWYEEDCQYIAVVLAFPMYFKSEPKILREALTIGKSLYPLHYAKYTAKWNILKHVLAEMAEETAFACEE